MRTSEPRAHSRFLRILHIEDDAADVAIVRKMLERINVGRFKVTLAIRIADALAAISRTLPDLILLDLSLPDARDLEGLVKIRRIALNVPIVVITGNEAEHLASEAIAKHADDYVTKQSMDPGGLKRAIQCAIQRKKIEQELARRTNTLRSSEANLRRVLAASSDAIVIISKEGLVLFANPAAEDLFEQKVAELQEAPFRLPLKCGAIQEVNIGRGGVAEMRVVETLWEGEKAFLASLRDITGRIQRAEEMEALNKQLNEANDRLNELAKVDPLSGLLNRRGFNAVLSKELSRHQRHGVPMAAAFIDCDNFKKINDTLGHAVGDIVLNEIAQRIKSSLRPSDHLARIGGDEFLALLPETRLAEARILAERLRLSVVNSSIVVNSKPMTVTISLAVIPVASEVCSLEEILTIGHSGIKQSKMGGRNRISVVSDEKSIQPTDSFDHVIQTLQQGTCFRTVAQPIYRLENKEVLGYELLSRGPPGIFENPLDFFRIAMQKNILTVVDLSCLKTAIAAAERFEKHTKFFLNLFPSTILSTSSERLLQLLRDSIGPESFCIEISEQQFIGDPANLRDPVRELRHKGVRFGLDDVGFGRSSLESLVLLEPEFVKIDRNFIHGVSADTGKIRSLRRIVSLARTLGSDVVAEGIEEESALEVLQHLGVEYGQGFLWGSPA